MNRSLSHAGRTISVHKTANVVVDHRHAWWLARWHAGWWVISGDIVLGAVVPRSNYYSSTTDTFLFCQRSVWNWRTSRSSSCSTSPSKLLYYSYRTTSSQPPRIKYMYPDASTEIANPMWNIPPDLLPHCRASLRGHFLTEDREMENKDSGFHVCFLGTGAGTPSVIRNCASTALRLGSTIFLFDAGEGVQRQLMLSRLNVGDIRKIFITHLHGDHTFGLPGLLLNLKRIAKTSMGLGTNNRQLVQVYGPVGLFNYVASSITLSCSELKHLTVEIYELWGGSFSPIRNPAAAPEYREFRHRGLLRRRIPQNQDGTWTILEAFEITTPEQVEQHHERGVSYPQGVHIQAAEVLHLPGVQCFGYVVREPFTLPRNIHPDKALTAGISPSKKYQTLKYGFPVMNDDNTRLVHPDEVLTNDQIQPRRFALLGDCCRVPPPMTKLCRDVDLLVHEATLLESDTESKEYERGHSTPAKAGEFAARVGAKVVALNHLSPNVFGLNALALIDEATNAAKGKSKILLCADHLEVVIPRGGFQFERHEQCDQNGESTPEQDGFQEVRSM